LLAANAQRIFDAGIRRINVSLDSLDPEKYAQITGYHQFDRVWAGIQLAHEIGFAPIKINVVAMRGVNDDEIIDFGRLSLDHPFHIRFIEYMPIGNSRTIPGTRF
jgi:cyclic pyranopterin phosphate synthase